MDNPLAGLYLNYAMRALLGGGKGQYVMQQLKTDAPDIYEAVMAGARTLLARKGVYPDKLNTNSRIATLKTLVVQNLHNMANITEEITK